MDVVDAHVAACGDCSAFLRVCKELSCRDFVEFLNDFIDDELPAERRAVFERHLEICEDCRRYVQSYRSAMELSALAFMEQSVPGLPPVPEALVRAILAARPCPPSDP